MKITYWHIFILSVSVNKSGESSLVTKLERAIKVSTQLLDRPFFSNICLIKFNLCSSNILLKPKKIQVN